MRLAMCKKRTRNAQRMIVPCHMTIAAEHLELIARLDNLLHELCLATAVHAVSFSVQSFAGREYTLGVCGPISWTWQQRRPNQAGIKGECAIVNRILSPLHASSVTLTNDEPKTHSIASSPFDNSAIVVKYRPFPARWSLNQLVYKPR